MKYFTTMTEKGQITLPAAIRRRWQIKAGQRVQVEVRSNGEVVVEPLINEDKLRRETRQYLADQGFTPSLLREMAEDYQNGNGFKMHLKEKYG